MTNDQYLTVGRAIINATDVSKVISLYEEAMEGRISADKYNLLAAQAAGIDSLNKYQPKQLDEDVELGEILEAELERLDAEARNYINNVTEQQYAANKQIITNKVNETKAAMAEVYDLANTKAAEADNLLE